MKKKLKKVNTLLCGLISFLIQYCMKASKVNPKKTRHEDVLSSSKQKDIALKDYLVD
jgi:hypothetical protein